MLYARYVSIFIGLVWLFTAGLTYAQLPWELIAEKYDQEVLLSEKSGEISVYSISKGLEIALNSPNQTGRSQTTFSLQKWTSQQWNPLSTGSIAAMRGAGLQIDKDKLGKGFFKVLFTNHDDLSRVNVYYFLVDPDWKKELMSYCRENKKNTETHLQASDISASIIRSHFYNLQEEIAKSRFLTGDILIRLSLTLKSRQQFEQGEIPDFVIGLNKLRFKRFEGAEYADFVLHVPEDYDPSVKWPLYIHVDPSRWGVGKYGDLNDWNRNVYHEGMLDLWWHSVTHKDTRWKDYVFFMEVLRKKIDIDSDRIYLYGLCGNGIAAMALALNYPNEWTECIMSTGNSYRHLAGNAFNLPIKYDNAHPENVEQTAYFQFAIKCFTYNNCQYFEYSNSHDLTVRRGLDIPQSRKVSSPKCVQYTIESLQSPKLHWVTVLGREDENYVARIEASVDGQKIILNRKNIDAYQVDLKLTPLDHTQPMTITDNGKSISVAPQEIFTYQSSKYDQAKYVKNSQLHGPISDVFTDAYTVLYTHGKDSKQTKKIATIAKQIAGTGPCIPEGDLSDEIIQNHNIVIVGRTGKSQIFNQISDRLPIHAESNKIAFDGQSISGDIGVMMIYPNPLNPKKYIALILASSNLALKKISNVWKSDIANAKVDVAVFKVGSENKYDFIRMEKFNTVWGWHDHWSVPLAQVSKGYPKWRWRQWIAHVMRHQLESDVTISEEIIEKPELLSDETITLRDLNKILKDQWFVKIKLNGKEFRRLLMQSASKNMAGNNKTENPVVDGICFIKSMADPDCMHISDIKADQNYTIAMPYKAVNGSRIGMILKDYEIVGDGYLLQMLYDYLKNRDSLGLDSELEKMKLTIM